jgi:hypothetical protein
VRELAELPLTIRGFGPVKHANAERAAAAAGPICWRPSPQAATAPARGGRVIGALFPDCHAAVPS